MTYRILYQQNFRTFVPGVHGAPLSQRQRIGDAKRTKGSGEKPRAPRGGSPFVAHKRVDKT